MQNGREEGTTPEGLPHKRHAHEGPLHFQPVDHSQARAGGYDGDGDTSQAYATPISPAYLPRGSKSLSGISMRAFSLGLVLGLSFSLSLFLMAHTTLWRAPAFLALLSLFHFLEYWTTARYNTAQANTSAFLLTSNGPAYSFAHSAAMLEFLISHYFGLSFIHLWVPERYKYVPLALGVLLLLVGQTTRSLAMAQAGKNFNHHVQTKRAASHELVTDGIYAWLRHPSYFGFFWWGLGTQLLLGNSLCFIGYSLVLWRFFWGRIRGTYSFPCFLLNSTASLAPT
jgi:protein-S-isoprenylcysteine O-methyltransferase